MPPAIFVTVARIKLTPFPFFLIKDLHFIIEFWPTTPEQNISKSFIITSVLISKRDVQLHLLHFGIRRMLHVGIRRSCLADVDSLNFSSQRHEILTGTFTLLAKRKTLSNGNIEPISWVYKDSSTARRPKEKEGKSSAYNESGKSDMGKDEDRDSHILDKARARTTSLVERKDRMWRFMWEAEETNQQIE
ncbi:conserved hypothetical protein [Ricinus communis]|uniref:Uncharacterized protein n=1 Tax=Ricinus communis TaxID=3988 RepID=B9SN23_RICCO|nr:conserved hypothetical protein [Ricinus communis]